VETKGIANYCFSSKTHLVGQRERKLYTFTALAKVVWQQRARVLL